MKAEVRCSDARVLISARLDDEVTPVEARLLDDHLERCSECRRHQVSIAEARRTLRLQPAPQVPDLAPHVIARLQREQSGHAWGPLARTASIAAVAAAIAFGAFALPQDSARRDAAAAGALVDDVRSAGRSVSTFAATFSVVEHGWHPRVPTRHFTARVAFAAPERLRFELDDLTEYPSDRWPVNDVRLVARPDAWTLEEPVACPPVALPHCAPARERATTSIVKRQPFDGSSVLPTDMIVPLETLVSEAAVEIVGPDNVAGRGALRVRMPFANAAPLVQSFQPGGSWRPLHPLDDVTLWLDAETWIPLKFEVRAGDSPDRALWEVRAGAESDSPGGLLLRAEATAFDTDPQIDEAEFQNARNPRPVSGLFRPASFEDLAGLRPRYVAGLEPYRAGTTAGGRSILAYSDGLLWLKVTYEPRSRQGPVLTAEEVSLGDAGRGYYEPSGALPRRRLDLFTSTEHVYVESNLPRTTLLNVGASLPVVGRRVGGDGSAHRVTSSDPWSVVPFALAPTWLPPGYDATEPTAASTTRSATRATLTVHFLRSETEFEGQGIRIAQAYPASSLPPSSRSFVATTVDGQRARWSIERSELEWIDDGVYRAVATPNYDLATALEIARNLGDPS